MSIVLFFHYCVMVLPNIVSIIVYFAAIYLCVFIYK